MENKPSVSEAEIVQDLYQKTFGEKPGSIEKLPDSGSDRKYFRLSGSSVTVIGAYNKDLKENEAFISFTRSFHSFGLPVPEMIAEDLRNHCYLISDLGDLTLFSSLTSLRENTSVFPVRIIELYKEVLRILIKFQILGGNKVDFSKSYPRHAFDRQSMLWDLNYFKYYFLKLVHLPFDEQALEEDFNTFTTFLLQADPDYFMYRDFQSRNIMLVNDKPYFIDYQGGRKGPLQYDVASLLYDAKADLPQEVREQLLGFYLDAMVQYLPGMRRKFLHFYPGFILIRILQALGAYGYRGYYQQKRHFLKSIPYAINNLRNLRNLWLEGKFGVELPAVYAVLDKLILDPIYTQPPAPPHNERGKSIIPDPISQISNPLTLIVTINSFSYKKGIPADPTENGGGFVFDCRALPNPGRYEEFKQLNGMDQQVIDFLGKEDAVASFLQNACSLVDQSVSDYLERDFQHLSVSFGCTGGQHRSVYCAEKMKEYLERKYKIVIRLNHTNLS